MIIQIYFRDKVCQVNAGTPQLVGLDLILLTLNIYNIFPIPCIKETFFDPIWDWWLHKYSKGNYLESIWGLTFKTDVFFKLYCVKRSAVLPVCMLFFFYYNKPIFNHKLTGLLLILLETFSVGTNMSKICRNIQHCKFLNKFLSLKAVVFV